MIKGRYRKLLEATICRPASLNFLKSFHLVVHSLHSLQSASRVRSHSCRQLRREGREGIFSPLPFPFYSLGSWLKTRKLFCLGISELIFNLFLCNFSSFKILGLYLYTSVYTSYWKKILFFIKCSFILFSVTLFEKITKIWNKPENNSM